MIKLKIFSLLPLFLFTFYGNNYSDKNEKYELLIPVERKMQIGEEITYLVSYAFIKIGEIKLSVTEKREINGKEYYVTFVSIDSYSGLPFVDLHHFYESHFSKEQDSYYFHGLVKYKDYYSYTDYIFDKEKKIIKVKKGKVSPPEVWTDSTTSLDKKYQDGLTIFYYARLNTGRNKSENIPCFVNEQKVYTKINFYDKVEPIKIKSINYEVACTKVDGVIGYTGVFGLTGEYEGWFSNDEAAVPILAKMKVIIGNVRIELIKWKVNNWQPPKYNK